MDYEWREAKREWTIGDRGLDVLDAIPLSDGRPALEAAARTRTRTQTRTEARTLTTGRLADGRLYTVVGTRRGEARRLISLRRAHDDEERRYEARHGPG